MIGRKVSRNTNSEDD